MRIGYKKRHVNLNLFLGIIWFVFCLIGFLVREKPYWTTYGYLIMSIAYLTICFFQKKYKYIVIENGIIKVNSFSRKKLKLNEIIKIKKFAGDYILKTNKNELAINTQLIEPESLIQLNTELEKLDVEWC